MSRNGRARKRTPSISATIVIVAVAGVCAAWAIAASGSGWVSRGLRSRTALVAGAALLGSLVALYVLAGAMWQLARRRRCGRPGGQAGNAAIEFALLLPVALMIVLIMIQSALLMTANLAVHHAGYSAVRAAVVWVPEKLSGTYEDEPRNVVGYPDTSEKLRRIKTAAVYRLLAISASDKGAAGGASDVLQEGLKRFYQLSGENVPAWVENALPGKFEYAWQYTEVLLHPPENGSVYGDYEELRVWLKHTVHLSVPYAARLFQLFGAARSLSAGDLIGSDVEVVYTLTNEGIEDDIDVEQFPRTVGRDGS